MRVQSIPENPNTASRFRWLPLALLLTWGTDLVLGDGPIDVGSRKQLFLDNKFIARSHGVQLVMNSPVKMNQPVLASDTPWEGEQGAAIDCYSSVIKDGDKIRIWGAGKPMLPVRLRADGPVVGLLKYAESKDGIHFTKPDLDVIAYDEAKAGVDQRARTGWSSVWIDPKGPPSQRYKNQAKIFAWLRRIKSGRGRMAR